MARTKNGSPSLNLGTFGDEDWAQAEASKSYGCLIANRIRELRPEFTNIVVDMVTIRFSDRKLGVRFTYLTPPNAQYALLALDQGWRLEIPEIIVQKAVKITPITRAKKGTWSTAAVAERRAARKAELEAKLERGEELTRGEKMALTKMSNPKPAPARPHTEGKAEVKGRHGREVVVVGGKPLIQGEPHPNLLRSSDRHFGAKLADPGVAFREAVEVAVAERMAAADGGG